MVNIARGCLILEEEEDGNGGRREDAQARPRSGAVVIIGPCENDTTTLWACISILFAGLESCQTDAQTDACGAF